MSAVIAPPAPDFIPARYKGGKQVPTLSVIHGTVSHDDPGTARQIAEWWHGPASPQTSAHYVVDPRELIQCVGDHTIAYHCGYNFNSLAWELCDEQVGPASRWKDADSRWIIQRAQDAIARAHLAYGIPIRLLSDGQLRAWDKAGRPAELGGIVTHAQMSRVFKKSTHTDPRELDMSAFVVGVRAAAHRLKEVAAGPKPTQVTSDGLLGGLAKPKRVPRRWSGFLHSSHYWETDSFRGVRAAAKRPGAKKALDVNTCGRSKDGVLLALHWSQPLLHGFRWDKSTPAHLRALPKTVSVHDLTMSEIGHLVAGRRGRCRIQPLEHVLDLAALLGVRIELEAKGGRTLERESTWEEVAGWRSTRSLVRRGLLQGKTLVLIPGAAKRLGAMKAAGLPTIVSTTGAKSHRLKLVEFTGCADFVRGPVEWVV